MLRTLTKLLFKFFCHICKYFWGYVPFCDFGTIKSTKKIIAALWERCCIRQIYFHCFKDMLMFFTKLWFKFFFCHICEHFRGYVSYLRFCQPKNHPKTVTALCKRCGIRQIYFHWLKRMLMILTKLWFKFFSHISEYLLCNVQLLWCFHPDKTLKSYQSFLKWVWHRLKLLASFGVYNKISSKIAI